MKSIKNSDGSFVVDARKEYFGCFVSIDPNKISVFYDAPEINIVTEEEWIDLLRNNSQMYLWEDPELSAIFLKVCQFRRNFDTANTINGNRSFIHLFHDNIRRYDIEH